MTFIPHHLRGNPPSSYIPPHLRGIDPVKVAETPQPMYSEIQTDFSASVSTLQSGRAETKADLAPVSQDPNNHNAEGEEWARKMGLLPISTAAKQVPKTQHCSSNHGLQVGSSINHVHKSTENRNHHGAPSQTKSSANQSTPQRLTNAFGNERFHLKPDSTEQFNQYVLKRPATNGKKYTFKGPAPAAQQQNAPLTDNKSHIPNRPAPTPQQHPKASHKPAGFPEQSGQNGFQQNKVESENRTPFGKPDHHAVFSPKQMVAMNTEAQNMGNYKNPANSPHVKNGPWPSQYSIEGKSFNEKIADELKATEHVITYGAALTQDALVKTTGFKPRDHSVNFEDKISDDGVVDQTKEGIRATQGVDAATQLLDWDRKRWAPPPCDWENDRAGFDDSFIPEYIKEWRAEIPYGLSVIVDTACDEFSLGKCPIDNDVLIDPIEHPESTPGMSTHKFACSNF
jgi:hypothetical protein